ncbi:hypothetical protein L596_025672 [Steinernema carpocapsae]|uniref:Uncharacterized protein n=1 Tax=Steinernema carpocapsae TaxID=34508 RepID=A0A4U5M8G4_STECR|nr:hypothetical protein L596_025672 [Steinernema carpocapsae]
MLLEPNKTISLERFLIQPLPQKALLLDFDPVVHHKLLEQPASIQTRIEKVSSIRNHILNPLHIGHAGSAAGGSFVAHFGIPAKSTIYEEQWI